MLPLRSSRCTNNLIPRTRGDKQTVRDDITREEHEGRACMCRRKCRSVGTDRSLPSYLSERSQIENKMFHKSNRKEGVSTSIYLDGRPVAVAS